ncbi:MAG: hypothetical protein JWM68_633 [Verrucomicrobiales bacterium]|nr:hypothetical protein [Verrucomicrobiales bacterium]
MRRRQWKETDGGWMYLVGYSRHKNVDPQKYFGLSEPLSKDEEHEFTAAKDFDILFKGKR